jgi:hypothetical protein
MYLVFSIDLPQAMETVLSREMEASILVFLPYRANNNTLWQKAVL